MLKALIPYSDANSKLMFKPSVFFNELEKIDQKQRRKEEWLKASAYKQEYYRAKRKGLIVIADDGRPKLTDLAKTQFAIFQPEELKGALLLVTFDIEERLRMKRDEFRGLLRMLKFRQVQKSVWISKYDSRKVIVKEIERMKLNESVVIYEARDITQE